MLPPTCVSTGYLNRLLFAGKGAHRHVAAMKMYIDESGSSRIFVVAGYLATIENWDVFDIRWTQALTDAEHFERTPKPYGSMRVRPFHMTDFDNPENTYYKDWTKERKTALIINLLDIINNTVDCAFCCTLPLSLFEEMVPVGFRRDKTFSYMTCLKPVFIKTLEAVLRFPLGERTPLVLDRNDEVSSMALHVMNFIVEKFPQYEDLIGPFVYDSKAKQLPLQAADILAHEVMRNRDNKMLRNGRVRKSYQRLDKRRYITFDHDHGSMNQLTNELYEWAVGEKLIEPDPAVMAYIAATKSKENPDPTSLEDSVP
jgi:hypothetical protein